MHVEPDRQPIQQPDRHVVVQFNKYLFKEIMILQYLGKIYKNVIFREGKEGKGRACEKNFLLSRPLGPRQRCVT